VCYCQTRGGGETARQVPRAVRSGPTGRMKMKPGQREWTGGLRGKRVIEIATFLFLFFTLIKLNLGFLFLTLGFRAFHTFPGPLLF